MSPCYIFTQIIDIYDEHGTYILGEKDSRTMTQNFCLVNTYEAYLAGSDGLLCRIPS